MHCESRAHLQYLASSWLRENKGHVVKHPMRGVHIKSAEQILTEAESWRVLMHTAVWITSSFSVCGTQRAPGQRGASGLHHDDVPHLCV